MTFAFDKNILVFSPNLFERISGKTYECFFNSSYQLFIRFFFTTIKTLSTTFWSIQVNNRSIAILVLPNPCS